MGIFPSCTVPLVAYIPKDLYEKSEMLDEYVYVRSICGCCIIGESGYWL